MKFLIGIMLLLPSLSFAYSNSIDEADFNLEFRRCDMIIKKEDSITKNRSGGEHLKCNRAGTKTVLCSVVFDDLKPPESNLYFVKTDKLDDESTLEFGTDDGKERIIVSDRRAEYLKKSGTDDTFYCRGSYLDKEVWSKMVLVNISKGLEKPAKLLTGVPNE